MSGSSVPATRLASSGVYPPVLQRVREDGNETGIVGRLSREVGISLLAKRKTACAGSAPRSAWIQFPPAPFSVRAHRPTCLGPSQS